MATLNLFQESSAITAQHEFSRLAVSVGML
jgi:hypothetical protein